ncbi:DNA-binding transcriptional regulator, LysR family [Terribacillus halophilus]|uniref:DNA-binding transcriptional regulator, LysR family n=2 Tax=Terribacillus halophilus TaxID=361279 RepID=A0A1G6HUJ9_9BACI|nr:DNA-binding transcriptional regulator, LysR family [Terribacillus halophilus]
MHMDELETFLTLAREKNFTRTAAIRGLSQPTVTVHIKNLENEFSTAFITRTTKHVQLTTEGELFYDHALQMMTLYKNIKETLYEQKNHVSGLLRIGASYTIGEYLLPKVLAHLHAVYDHLEFQLTIGNSDSVIETVRRFEVDIGLVEGEIHSREVLQESFQEDQLVIVSSSAKPIRTVEELSEQVWIIREEGSGTRQAFDHFVSEKGLRIKSRFIFSSTQAIKNAVSSGMGIALLSQAAIQEELRYGTLQVVSINGFQEKRSFSYVIAKKKQITKNMELFLDSLLSG